MLKIRRLKIILNLKLLQFLLLFMKKNINQKYYKWLTRTLKSSPPPIADLILKSL